MGGTVKHIKEKVQMRQIFSMLLTLLLMLVIAVCLTGNRQSTKPIEEVAEPVLAAFADTRTTESPGRMLKKYYGLNPEDYQDVILYFPLTNMDAEELLIIRLADPSQAEEVREAIRLRQQTQIGIYENYAPEQLALCEQAVIDICGNYVLYVVYEQASEIDRIFRSSL